MKEQGARCGEALPIWGRQTKAINTIKELGNPPVNAEQVARLLTAFTPI